MSIMTYLGAIGAAQREALNADERVVLIGEDVEANVYGTTGGTGKSRAAEGDFLQTFGRNRIRNTPISEESIVGAAAGAAMTGLRPIVDLSYSSFLYMAMDQFVNQVAKNSSTSSSRLLLEDDGQRKVLRVSGEPVEDGLCTRGFRTLGEEVRVLVLLDLRQLAGHRPEHTSDTEPDHERGDGNGQGDAATLHVGVLPIGAKVYTNLVHGCGVALPHAHPRCAQPA